MGDANLIYNSICCYMFDVFFDMLSHLVHTILTDWARLGLPVARLDAVGLGGRRRLPSVYMYSLSTTTIPPIAVGEVVIYIGLICKIIL